VRAGAGGREQGADQAALAHLRAGDAGGEEALGEAGLGTGAGAARGDADGQWLGLAADGAAGAEPARGASWVRSIVPWASAMKVAWLRQCVPSFWVRSVVISTGRPGANPAAVTRRGTSTMASWGSISSVAVIWASLAVQSVPWQA
jgi:hypothetical protein